MKSIVIAIVLTAAFSSGCTNIEGKFDRAVDGARHGEPVDLAKEQQKEGG
jgi:hypothetical protein